MKQFLKYVVPSMVSFLFTGIYVGVDGFFVGQTVGDAGLAALNIAWPMGAAIMAAGTGIGMGGAVSVSNHLGANEKPKADIALGNTLTLLLLASAVLTTVLVLGARQILIFMGAKDAVLELAHGYMEVIAWGAVLQVMATGITPLLRNQSKTWLAMTLMIVNFAVDTVLSGIFVMVLGYGVIGAAAASLIGQFLAVVPALFVLFRREDRVASFHYVLKGSTVLRILKIGLSPFGLSFIPAFTIMVVNWQAMSYGGTAAVAAYAVISYILAVGQLLLQGVGDGSQPLLSFYHGAGNRDAIDRVRRWTYYLSLAMATAAMATIILLRNHIPVLFGVSPETAVLLRLALPICALSLPFYAFTRASSSYFYATQQARSASALVYGEALAALPVCVLLLPLFFGLAGVWGAQILAQLLLLIAAVLLLKRSKAPGQTG